MSYKVGDWVEIVSSPQFPEWQDRPARVSSTHNGELRVYIPSLGKGFNLAGKDVVLRPYDIYTQE